MYRSNSISKTIFVLFTWGGLGGIAPHSVAKLELCRRVTWHVTGILRHVTWHRASQCYKPVSHLICKLKQQENEDDQVDGSWDLRVFDESCASTLMTGQTRPRVDGSLSEFTRHIINRVCINSHIIGFSSFSLTWISGFPFVFEPCQPFCWAETEHCL